MLYTVVVQTELFPAQFNFSLSHFSHRHYFLYVSLINVKSSFYLIHFVFRQRLREDHRYLRVENIGGKSIRFGYKRREIIFYNDTRSRTVSP